jgi:fumarate hydratase subunit alpha/L(+)-tartrate dehydratase alpha subunit
MHVDLKAVEEAARDLYIRALKVLPDDVKQGFDRLARAETNPRAQQILGTMIRNIAVAEETHNLTCQDTGVPIYNVTIGRDVRVDGVDLR